MLHWKSQLKVMREGPKCEESRIVRLCRQVLCASEVVFDGHTERTQLGQSQAVNQMNLRAVSLRTVLQPLANSSFLQNQGQLLDQEVLQELDNASISK